MNFKLNAFTVLATAFIAFSASCPAIDVSGVRKDEVLQQELTKKISDRKKVILENDVKLQALCDQLDGARKRLNDAVALTPPVLQFDAAHREKLKQYGDFEARFNSLKTHWTTHNKAPVATNGLPAASVKALPGCRFCQSDFDKFVAGDSLVLDGYKQLAEQILGHMSVARSGLLNLTVSRSKLVAKTIQHDPKLTALAADVDRLEKSIEATYAADKEIASLTSQRDSCRERLGTTGNLEKAPQFGPSEGPS